MRYYEGLLRKRFQSILDDIYCEKNVIENYVRGLPKGRLHIRKNGNKCYYNLWHNGKEKGITKNKELIKTLQLRQILEKELKRIEAEELYVVKTLERINDIEEDDILARKWLEEPWEKYAAYPDKLLYRTKSGIMVRSKSEKIIADMLYEYGLPFRYECGIECDGEYLWPDFVIRKKNGEIVIWEHMGLMSRQDYFYKNIEKIKKYRSVGFVQHNNLICTWEEDLYDIEELKKIIEKFLL